MRAVTALAGLVLLFALCGCVPSIHPLYTEADLIFDPAIVGDWADKEAKQNWTFAKAGPKEYTVTLVDGDGKKGVFSGHLLKLDGTLFMDLYPSELQLKESDFYRSHFVPTHTFARIQIGDAGLKLAALKPDWMKSSLEANPAALGHEKLEEGVVLTASTKDLQAFVVKNLKTADAWAENDALQKKAEQPKK
jgi:hypothetical protein